jgi:hypothetical protein
MDHCGDLLPSTRLRAWTAERVIEVHNREYAVGTVAGVISRIILVQKFANWKPSVEEFGGYMGTKYKNRMYTCRHLVEERITMSHVCANSQRCTIVFTVLKRVATSDSKESSDPFPIKIFSFPWL